MPVADFRSFGQSFEYNQQFDKRDGYEDEKMRHERIIMPQSKLAEPDLSIIIRNSRLGNYNKSLVEEKQSNSLGKISNLLSYLPHNNNSNTLLNNTHAEPVRFQ